MTAPNEEIRVICPTGSERWLFSIALDVGLRFASEYIDRRAGYAGAVVYSGSGGWAFVAYWTAARRVVVRAQRSDP